MIYNVNQIYSVGLYIRLSREDDDKVLESESITNQKRLLLQYVKENYLTVYDIYVDDGYSGTNFDRPDFNRLLSDIELGKVNMVITKDMSRLGRDYIGTGNLIEKYFPEHNVRYIAVTDNIDTFLDNSNNDIAPFKAIMNDMYAKDISKKIKSSLRAKQKEGKWVSGRYPFGYMQDPSDKNHLVINEEQAFVVKRIYHMCLDGLSCFKIAKQLTNEGVKTPAQYYNFEWKSHYNLNYGIWNSKTIRDILTNQMYIGNLVQNKRNKVNYKVKKIVTNNPENYIVVENTHEPIIDKKTFDAVQKMIITQSYNRNEKKHHFLLDGLLVCYECKHKIGVRTRKNGRLDMICNNYRRNSKLGLCTSHGFNYEQLEKIVLEYIKKLFIEIDSKKIELNIKNNISKYDYGKMLQKLETEIELINDNIDKMYVDKLNGKVSEEMYERLFNKLKGNIKQKEEEYIGLKNEQENNSDDDIENIKKLVNDFLKLEKPTPEVMKVLINRIEVHQDKQVDIIFNFKKLNNAYNRNSDINLNLF